MWWWTGFWTHKEHNRDAQRNLNGVCGLDGNVSVFTFWFWWLTCGRVEECLLFVKHTRLTSLRIFSFCSLCFFSQFFVWVAAFHGLSHLLSEASPITALSKAPALSTSVSLYVVYFIHSIHCYLWLPSYFFNIWVRLWSGSSWEQRPSLCRILSLKQCLIPSGSAVSICWVSDCTYEIWPLSAGYSCSQFGYILTGQLALSNVVEVSV